MGLNSQGEIEWLNNQFQIIANRRRIIDVKNGIFEMGQSGSERLIKLTQDAQRAKSILIVYVLMDQIVHDKYYSDHYEFEQYFKIPKLNSHGSIGCSHPSWFTYEYHNHHKNMDYELLEKITLDALTIFNNYFRTKSTTGCIGWECAFEQEFNQFNTQTTESLKNGYEKFLKLRD